MIGEQGRGEEKRRAGERMGEEESRGEERRREGWRGVQSRANTPAAHPSLIVMM